MRKRILACLLCLSILLGCCSIPTLAANTVTQTQVEQQLSKLASEWLARKYYNDSFNGATQCKGFADMLFSKLFGYTFNIGSYVWGDFYYLNLTYPNSIQEVGRIKPGYTEEDVEPVQALLSQALPGDYIQLCRDKGYTRYGHSMIVMDRDAAGLWLLHANWDSKNGVQLDYFTWAQLTQMSNGISLYHHKAYTADGGAPTYDPSTIVPDPTIPDPDTPTPDPDPDPDPEPDPDPDPDPTPDPEPDPIIYWDVSWKDWFYESVQTVAQNSLMNGVSATHFDPRGQMNRAMVATVLYRLSGDPTGYEVTFPDVKSDTWYSDGVGWAQLYSLTTGYPDGTFHPKESITREQLAVFLYRFTEFEGRYSPLRGDLTQFRDAGQISSYAQEALGWSVGVGIFSGYPDGTIKPKATATRAEVAKVLSVYWSLYRTVDGEWPESQQMLALMASCK